MSPLTATLNTNNKSQIEITIRQFPTWNLTIQENTEQMPSVGGC